MKMVKFGVSMVLVATLFGLTGSLQAITITRSSTTLFSDDFESQTVGAGQITGNMNPGASGSSWSGVGSGLIVRNSLTPGTFQGTNYLEVARPGNSATGRGDANFTAITAGQTVEISLAYNLNVGVTSLLLGNSTTNAINIGATGAGGTFEFYDSAGVLNATSTLTKGLNDQWHTMKLTWTHGSTNVTLAIDGTSEVIAGAVSVANSSVLPSRVRIQANSGSIGYIDSVPEPNSILLIGMSILGLGTLLIRKRSNK